MDAWVEESAARVAARARRELEALVGVSSPSGDVAGAEECVAICAALVPDEAITTRLACSSPEHAPDFLATVHGTGSARIVLLGHLDTVVAHGAHRALHARGDHLVGSGSADMKGGVVLALGVLRVLATLPERFAEVALLLVCDEEWRTAPFAHGARFAGWDACLCFEAGERTASGDDAVVVRRKAAGTLRVTAHGRSAHSGSAPDRGRNALLAVADAARAVAAFHAPHGPARRSAVPTVLRSGSAFNVVPDHGELLCDVRADADAAIHEVVAGIPDASGGVELRTELVRLWPGMDSTAVTGPLLDAAGALLGRRIRRASRGGASDASHFTPHIALTVDGLGPLGGLAHHPGEYVVASSLQPRAEVALAVATTALAS